MTQDLTTEQREAVLSELGLTYSAVFVPRSESRNAKQKELTINWRVTIIAKNGRALTTDYMQGIGHHPVYRDAKRRGTLAMSLANAGVYNESIEKGFWFAGYRKHVLPQPALLEVMYSLAMDAGAIEHATFEDWAAEFGYDPDSRKGEVLYRECLAIALKLRAMLGDNGLAKLREAVDGY